MRDVRRTARRLLTILAATLAAAVLFAASAFAAADIVLTFVRHGQSQANADGIINTEVPGPHITALGQQQAALVAGVLAAGGYQGIYASDMVRTQETAAPLADILGESVTVLPGLREIDAGIYEGSSETDGLGRLGYGLTPALWTLGLRSAWIPDSTDTNGNVFSDRMSEAVQIIYEDGWARPVAFSHGATIMFWTMMNVDNPDLGLLLSHQLPNTGVVVLEGNPEDGWTLVSWDGVAVDPDPSFLTKTFVNVRELITTPQTAVYNVKKAFATGDLAAITDSFARAVIDVVLAPVRFVGAVATDVLELVFPPAPSVQVEAPMSAESTTDESDVPADVPDDVVAVAPSEDVESRTPEAASDEAETPVESEATEPEALESEEPEIEALESEKQEVETETTEETTTAGTTGDDDTDETDDGAAAKEAA
ncbi:histidine phosphatase family protein [Mycolicibacterium vanbaalenii]|uniref:histidine phosphatase family protein n=1 Tax=Mycolicibacterium TaxID=1866885 RepID=UPI001F1FA7DC|nr:MULTISPECIES: histidine phosphatase family protein [Mycolicibacterium]MDW5614023.1 histidine phosphatase family protein [Mycolicibacterium sp. D5.8-2]UJL30820.1 histidine phosphatase family protein [Mycolicibacterium vanbaalenii]WND56070.1 histidine phosphatase family protein [Mycolicibacterium vanbaalenii]